MSREFSLQKEQDVSLDQINPEECQNQYKLQQLVSHYRSQAKKLEISFRDLKLKYVQETEKLKSQLANEKKRRVQLHEEKVERSN